MAKNPDEAMFAKRMPMVEKFGAPGQGNEGDSYDTPPFSLSGPSPRPGFSNPFPFNNVNLDGDGPRPAIVFPDLEQGKIPRSLVVVGYLLLACGLGLYVAGSHVREWRFSGLLLIEILLVGWVVYCFWLSRLNNTIHAEWAGTFARFENPHALFRKLRLAPQAYLVHIRIYEGASGARPAPAAVVEVRETGERIAVHPANKEIVAVCNIIGVETVTTRT